MSHLLLLLIAKSAEVLLNVQGPVPPSACSSIGALQNLPYPLQDALLSKCSAVPFSACSRVEHRTRSQACQQVNKIHSMASLAGDRLFPFSWAPLMTSSRPTLLTQTTSLWSSPPCTQCHQYHGNRMQDALALIQLSCIFLCECSCFWAFQLALLCVESKRQHCLTSFR